VLAAKAEALDSTIRELSAMRDSLRHAAACPAPSHMACPTFRRLLRAAASGALGTRMNVGSWSSGWQNARRWSRRRMPSLSMSAVPLWAGRRHGRRCERIAGRIIRWSPSPHAAPYVWLGLGRPRRRHTAHPRLSGSEEYAAYGHVHGNQSGKVREIVALASNLWVIHTQMHFVACLVGVPCIW